MIRLLIPPGRPGDGAEVRAVTLYLPEERKGVALIIPVNTVNGVPYEEVPIIVAEGMMVTQKSRG